MRVCKRLTRTRPLSSANKALSLHSTQFTFHEQEGNTRVDALLVHIRATLPGSAQTLPLAITAHFKNLAWAQCSFWYSSQNSCGPWAEYHRKMVSRCWTTAAPDSSILFRTTVECWVPNMSHQLNFYCTRKPRRKCSRCAFVWARATAALMHTGVSTNADNVRLAATAVSSMLLHSFMQWKDANPNDVHYKQQVCTSSTFLLPLMDTQHCVCVHRTAAHGMWWFGQTSVDYTSIRSAVQLYCTVDKMQTMLFTSALHGVPGQFHRIPVQNISHAGQEGNAYSSATMKCTSTVEHCLLNPSSCFRPAQSA